MGPFGKVRTPDRPYEQGVSGDQGVGDLVVQAYASAGMAGGVDHPEPVLPQVDDLAVADVLHVAAPEGVSERPVKYVERVAVPQMDRVLRMRIRLASELLGHGLDPADMVRVTMGEDQHVQIGAAEGGAYLGHQPRRIPPQSRVDEDVPVACDQVDVGIARIGDADADDSHESAI